MCWPTFKIKELCPVLNTIWFYSMPVQTCVAECARNGGLYMPEDVPLVEFMYLVVTRMPGESYRSDPMLCLFDVFRALINYLVCWHMHTRTHARTHTHTHTQTRMNSQLINQILRNHSKFAGRFTERGDWVSVDMREIDWLLKQFSRDFSCSPYSCSAFVQFGTFRLCLWCLFTCLLTVSVNTFCMHGLFSLLLLHF